MNEDIVRRKPKVCGSCGQFSTKWVFCKECKHLICRGCAASTHQCADHFLKKNELLLLRDYFGDKYAPKVTV